MVGSEDAGEYALRMESLRVFGMNEACYVQPSKDNIEDDLEGHENVVVYTKDTDDDGELEDVTYQEAYESSFAYALFEAEDDLKDTQAKIDAADDLKALSAELKAAKAAFEKSIDEQYTEAFGELETALAAANTDLAAKQDALDEQEAKFNDIDVEIAKLQAQIAAENELLYTLQTAAWKYLNITWPTESSTDGEGKPVKPQTDWSKENGIYEPEEFAKDLQEAIELQKLVVCFGTG